MSDGQLDFDTTPLNPMLEWWGRGGFLRLLAHLTSPSVDASWPHEPSGGDFDVMEYWIYTYEPLFGLNSLFNARSLQNKEEETQLFPNHHEHID